MMNKADKIPGCHEAYIPVEVGVNPVDMSLKRWLSLSLKRPREVGGITLTGIILTKSSQVTQLGSSRTEVQTQA